MLNAGSLFYQTSALTTELKRRPSTSEGAKSKIAGYNPLQFCNNFLYSLAEVNLKNLNVVVVLVLVAVVQSKAP